VDICLCQQKNNIYAKKMHYILEISRSTPLFYKGSRAIVENNCSKKVTDILIKHSVDANIAPFAEINAGQVIEWYLRLFQKAGEVK